MAMAAEFALRIVVAIHRRVSFFARAVRHDYYHPARSRGCRVCSGGMVWSCPSPYAMPLDSRWQHQPCANFKLQRERGLDRRRAQPNVEDLLLTANTDSTSSCSLSMRFAFSWSLLLRPHPGWRLPARQQAVVGHLFPYLSIVATGSVGV